MTTQFCFEHVFRAPSLAAVFEAYFDPSNLLHQDRMLDIVGRTVLELVDDGATLRRTSRVVPRRQLPAIVRPFVETPLHYVETATWRRHDDELDLAIWPSILRRRKANRPPAITATYRLLRLADGSIRRTYQGTVSVDIALLASRIERGIIAEFERSMPVAASCTQQFLDQTARSLSARA